MGNPTFITVTDPNYRVGISGGTGDLPLGHGGFIVTDGSGTGTYYEFGLYQQGTFTNVNGANSFSPNGAIRSLTLTGLEYDSSGNVTQQSMQSALDQVFGSSGMYTSDTGMAIASTFSISQQQYDTITQSFIPSQIAGLTSGSERYSISNNDCQQFVLNAATSAGLTVEANQNGSGPALPSLDFVNIEQNASANYQYFGPNSWKGSAIQPDSGFSATLNSLEDAAVQVSEAIGRSTLDIGSRVLKAVSDAIITPANGAEATQTQNGLTVTDGSESYEFIQQTGVNVSASSDGVGTIVDLEGGNTLTAQNSQTVIDAAAATAGGVTVGQADTVNATGATVDVMSQAQATVTGSSNTIVADVNTSVDAVGSNDILFVTAAGNTAQNNDTTPRYPCVYDQPNQICVAASDQNDHLWSSSNYGAQTVDLAAPGVNILSTLRNGAYGLISGCSMSAAQVSGAAALVLSTGYQSVTSLKATLLSGVDLLPAFTSTTRTGGRLDICKAISGCAAANPPLAITTTSLPNGAVGTAYSTTLSASGGTPPYTWTESGSLPPGLALSTNGSLSGTPTAAGAWNFVAQVTDAHSANATQTLTITVNSASTAAITLVQATSGQASGVPSISQTFPSANTSGNLIIALVRMSSTSQTVGVTDSAGNLYTDAVVQVQASDTHQVHIFYAKNILGGANTVKASFSSTNNHPWLAIFEYSGLSTTSPLDQTSSAQGSGTAVSTGTTAQTRASGELLFSGMGLPSTSTVSITAGSGYVVEQSDRTSPGSRAATEQGVVSSLGAFSATYSLSGSANWSAVLATFSATAIGGAPTLSVVHELSRLERRREKFSQLSVPLLLTQELSYLPRARDCR